MCHNFSEHFKTIGHIFFPNIYLIFFINVCVIVNKFDTWCDILNL